MGRVPGTRLGARRPFDSAGATVSCLSACSLAFSASTLAFLSVLTGFSAGLTGFSELAASKPDGYTIGVVNGSVATPQTLEVNFNNAFAAIQFANVPFETANRFALSFWDSPCSRINLTTSDRNSGA